MDQKERFAFGHLDSTKFDYDSYSKAKKTEENFDHEMDEALFSSSTNIEQNETIESDEKDAPTRSWKRPQSRTALERQFRDKYNALFFSKNKVTQAEMAINELIDILGQLTTYVIYERIWSFPVYKIGDEEEITQEGHIAAFEKLLEDIDRGSPRNDALYYYLTIYKYKTKDYLNFYGLLKRKKDANSNTGTRKSNTPKVSAIHSAPSIESLTTTHEGELLSDRMLDFSVNPFDDESDYHIEHCRKILKIYIEELLGNTNIPPAPLAVMYARVLYQLEKLLDANVVDKMVSQYMKKMNWSEDPKDSQYDEHLVKATEKIQQYSNSTASDWAIVRMGKQTVFELETDSETALHKLFDKTLVWGAAFREKVVSVSEKYPPLLWGAIVYTECYRKPQIENWATDIHNSTVVKTARRICVQQGLLNYVLEELDDRGRLKKEVRKKYQKGNNQGGAYK